MSDVPDDPDEPIHRPGTELDDEDLPTTKWLSETASEGRRVIIVPGGRRFVVTVTEL